MIDRVPSPQFEILRRQQDPKRWERERRNMGWNYAEAARAHGISVREWAMLECGVTPEQLREHEYPEKTGRIPYCQKSKRRLS